MGDDCPDVDQAMQGVGVVNKLNSGDGPVDDFEGQNKVVDLSPSGIGPENCDTFAEEDEARYVDGGEDESVKEEGVYHLSDSSPVVEDGNVDWWGVRVNETDDQNAERSQGIRWFDGSFEEELNNVDGEFTPIVPCGLDMLVVGVPEMQSALKEKANGWPGRWNDVIETLRVEIDRREHGDVHENGYLETKFLSRIAEKLGCNLNNFTGLEDDEISSAKLKAMHEKGIILGLNQRNVHFVALVPVDGGWKYYDSSRATGQTGQIVSTDELLRDAKCCISYVNVPHGTEMVSVPSQPLMYFTEIGSREAEFMNRMEISFDRAQRIADGSI